ncbi:L-lactate permease [Paenarthrobacter aurescens]|uniref:L-lactate permease n=1 Tax=Paenarthrobacter aurescens TaxID=43663 RepID=A0A4Y3NN05_PAEAU|nr:L-lactate permease [Paenarthrobacter aurescens]MDO6142206.1 L-lactate permease [Paenarthrobacter aurescens]MDO6146054.1 L-lactate permease [Paenarthrobacter aurescens]MDO6157298.1 L-lactate permease [Paenarthrobacter aurescens]MDO6161283.1 L-lactate permease [Paenarthrobacter aurescens]GEB20139.1 L-lactate permease [Paenarthrobacter aurescens]
MFQQILDPIAGSLALSAICAALPLILLFVLLGAFRVKAPIAALASLALSLLLAVIGWQMPVNQALSATAAGIFYGLFPILWILVNALWIYRLTVASPWFEVLGQTIRSISDDLRILSILIAFCFGALLESLAGFGAPVAISAAMLMAAGMKPLKSAVVSLLANTAPVAFGAMAAPIIALNGVTGLPLNELSSMAGRQTPFIALIVPLLLVFLVDGRRGVRQTWPVAVVAGVVFALAQFVTSNFFAVELTDVVAAVATVAAVLLMLKVWQPKESIAEDSADEELRGSSTASGTAALSRDGQAPTGSPAGRTSSIATTGAAAVADGSRPEARKVWMSIAPYLVIITVFSLAQVPVLKTWLAQVGSVTFAWPGLEIVDSAGQAVSGTKFKLDHLKATGTLLLISGVITMALYKISASRGLRVYKETLVQLRWTIVTVTAVLGLSFVMNLSGQTTTLGFALASAGGFFALLSPLIGWIGVALTGSDTSSNSLFGQMQATAAEQTGLSPVLMAASNSSAGVMGKMLSLQNLAVASAAVGLDGAEGTLFRKLVGWSLGLLALITVLIFLQSTPVLDWMVP